MGRPWRILLFGDTHLGFDLPRRPRSSRRRRGPDFLASYERVVRAARGGRFDVVVHAGDVFHRSRPPAGLVDYAFEPLRDLAESGIPVCVVPGNHERSRVPCGILARHPNLLLFDRPRTHVVSRDGEHLALAGFPFARRVDAPAFARLLEATRWREVAARARLLCLHQAVEGARVGPADFTFRRGGDVIPARALPGAFAAILSGHIHRHQVLTRDRGGRPLAAPILYPGSTERTSYAEVSETKGYLELTVTGTADGCGQVDAWSFVPLPTPPLPPPPTFARQGR